MSLPRPDKLFGQRVYVATQVLVAMMARHTHVSMDTLVEQSVVTADQLMNRVLSTQTPGVDRIPAAAE